MSTRSYMTTRMFVLYYVQLLQLLSDLLAVKQHRRYRVDSPIDGRCVYNTSNISVTISELSANLAAFLKELFALYPLMRE